MGACGVLCARDDGAIAAFSLALPICEVHCSTSHAATLPQLECRPDIRLTFL